MKKIISIINITFFLLIFSNIICSATSPDTTNSQTGTNQKSPTERLKFNLKPKFPYDVYNKYRFTENTKVTRVNSDSTKSEYKREVTYYFTLRAKEQPKEGLQKVFVTIDSLVYAWDDGIKTIKHYSGSDAASPLGHRDFLYYMIPLSKEFDVTYSSYGDIVDLSGENLFEKRENITNKERGILDSANRAFWVKRMADRDLLGICDVTRSLLPTFPIEVDSTWSVSPINIDVDHSAFKGKVIAKIKTMTDNAFFIEGKTDTLRCIDKTLKIPNMNNKEAKIIKGEAVAEYKMDFKTTGAVDYVSTTINGKIQANINDDKFDLIIESKFVLDLLRRYRY